MTSTDNAAASASASDLVPIQDRFISINGLVIDSWKNATISVFDTSFHRGDGVFEVMRLVPTTNNKNDTGTASPKIRCLSTHLKRLETSAKGVECPLPSKETLAEWLQAAASASGNLPGSLRLIATKGNAEFGVEPSVIINWSPIPPWPETFTLLPIVAWWHPAGMKGWETPVKWTSYGPNVVSTNKAKAKGYTDALLLSPHRMERLCRDDMNLTDDQIMNCDVLDGPNFAVAWVQETRKNGEMVLPPELHMPSNEQLGLLPSITQGRLAKIAEEMLAMKVDPSEYTLETMLANADEVFVMSTTRGLKTVTKIGDHTMPVKRDSSGNPKYTWAEKFSALLEEEGDDDDDGDLEL